MPRSVIQRNKTAAWPVLAGLASASISLFASTDYGPAIYRPMSGCTKWYTSGSGHHFAVIHDMEGYYWTTITYLNRCDKKTDGSLAVATSIHYMVNGLQNGSDEDGHRENNSTDPAAGEITQSVREAYYAWHARCWNTWMWGTEHEGFASSPAWYTEAMYQASGPLQKHLIDQTGHPVDRNHIIAHGEKSSASWVSWVAANYPSLDATCNTHTDPGVYWNWSRFMAIVLGSPAAPSNLTATPVSTTQIKLAWTDNSTNETGFKIERSTASGGTYAQIGTTGAGITIFTNSSLSASTAYFYRVCAYNANGNSDYSNIRSATTGNSAPTLTAIGNKTVTEGSTLTFTAKATDSSVGQVSLITDFEAYSAGTSSVMFQKPSYSGSTRGIDTTVTNYSVIATSFPTGSGKGSSVLKSSWTFVSTPTNWIRLTTLSTTGKPNPVIDLKQILKFDIYCDKALKVALGARETGNVVGTAIGSDGGTTNGIEWVGATSASGGVPVATRTLAASTWTTLQFNLPLEPVVAFAGTTANGVLSSPTGLGVLEHLALMPTTSSAGTYNVYLDNFSVVYSNALSFSLDAGAPSGASINPITGVFTWTPTEAQGPGIYSVTVRVTDGGSPALDDFETISISVVETNNAAPVLAAIPNSTILAGQTLTFTNSATDTDVPKEFTFGLEPGAPADVLLDPETGIFSWTPALDSLDSTNFITVTVTDAGPPQLSDAKTFSVKVISRIASATRIENGNVSLSWNTISGKKYRVQFKNNLSDATWTDLTGDIAGNGSPVSQTDADVSANDQRFYRIIEVP